MNDQRMAIKPTVTAFHVYPVADLKEHDTEGSLCWCHPSIEAGGQLIIHNSMDQRERYETGESKCH